MGNVSTWEQTSGGNNQGSPPDWFPEGMPPSGVNDAAREVQAALARWYADTQGQLTSAGIGNAYTLTSASNHAALADQSMLVFRADRANTGAATLAVDGLAAKAIQSNTGAALSAGDIQSGQMVAVIYDTTSSTYKMLAPIGVPSGVITLWSGSTASIPAGWTLCDGTSGTPDLRDRFVVGAGGAFAVDATGGSSTHNHGGTNNTTLSTSQIPGHTHGTGEVLISPGSPTDLSAMRGSGSAQNTGSTGGGGSHSHSISSVDHKPPFYALAYIMKL